MIGHRRTIGSTIINNLDISELGMFMTLNGGDSLLLFPERKQPKSNNWYEHNGLDVDLSDVYFNDRSLPIEFYIYSDNARDYERNLSEFYRLITKGYIILYSREFSHSFRLRYLSCSDYVHTGGLYKDGDKGGKMKMQFSMDDPLQLFTDPTVLQPRKLGSLLASETAYVLTDSGLFIEIGDATGMDNHISHVSLNGIDFGAFGIIVNECYSSILKQSAVKQPLTRSFAHRSGLKAYPSQSPTFEAKELVVKCTMRANSRAEFYYNYEALFNNLTKPEALEIDSFLGRASCYYSNMSDFKKLGVFSRGVMVQFTLHLTQIDPNFTYYVLGSLSDTAIVTDAEEFILYQN